MFLVVPIAAIVAATWRLVLRAIADDGSSPAAVGPDPLDGPLDGLPDGPLDGAGAPA
jgi:hypothetical protein